jgi:hypothetical protein
LKGKNVVLYIILTVMAVLVFQSVSQFGQPQAIDIGYSEFRDAVRNNLIEGVRIRGEKIQGSYRSEFPAGLVKDGLLDSLAGKRARRNIGGHHRTQPTVDFLDQAVRQAEAAGRDEVPGGHRLPV